MRVLVCFLNFGVVWMAIVANCLSGWAAPSGDNGDIPVYVNEDWPSCFGPKKVRCTRQGQHASYNRDSGKCEIRKGYACKRRENVFPNLATCNETCKGAPKPPCSLKPETGYGRAYHRRWYFNTKYAECQRFIFGGGVGNENNFVSKEECEKKCSELADGTYFI